MGLLEGHKRKVFWIGAVAVLLAAAVGIVIQNRWELRSTSGTMGLFTSSLTPFGILLILMLRRRWYWASLAAAVAFPLLLYVGWTALLERNPPPTRLSSVQTVCGGAPCVSS